MHEGAYSALTMRHARHKTARGRVGRAASLLRLLGDETRLGIIVRLVKNPSGLYVHELATALSMSHSAVSHQLGTLEAVGVVEGAREGQMVRYWIADTPAAAQALRVIKAALR